MSSFKQLIQKSKQSDSFWIEKAILEFTSDIYQEMKRQNKTNADMARILGTSPAYITKVFSGNANFTIQSMVKISRALNCRLHVKAVHESKKISYSHFPTNLGDMKPVQSDVSVNFIGDYYATSIAA